MLYKHVFRNALIPLVTGFPAAFVGAFFAGSLLIETLFSLDGLGLLSYEAVIRRDYPVVLGSLYLFTLIGLVVKLIGDLLYVVVDPRVQFAARGANERPTSRRAPTRAAADRRPRAAPARSAVAVAQPARLGALPAQPARLRVADRASSRCWCVSTFAELVSNDRPLVARYEGEWFFPIFSNQPETRFGGDFETPTDWHDPFIREQFAKPRQLGAVHAQPVFGAAPSTTSPRRPTRRRRPARTGSAPTRRAATWWRACSTASASASGSASR